VMFSDGLESEVYDDDFNILKLEKWIRQRQFPLVAQFSSSNFDEIAESGLFTVIGVLDGVYAPSSPHFLEAMKQSALAYRGKYHFGYIEASQWIRWLQSMSISTDPNDLPTVFVLNSPKEHYYLPKNPRDVKTKDGIVSFLKDIETGNIPAQGPSEWSPSKLIKRLDEWLTGTFTDTQILVGVSGIMGLFTIIMLWSICTLTDAPSNEEQPKEKKE
jgi:hypothetical protein